MAKKVVGTYASAAEAQNMAENMVQQGYPRESLTLMANELTLVGIDDQNIGTQAAFDCRDYSDPTLWERIKSFFGADDDNYSDSVISGHCDDIRNNMILLVVDDELAPDTLQDNDASWRTDVSTAQNQDLDDETIRLEREQMNIDKDTVESGEVLLHKRVVEENETVNVPVRHEELVIERRPVDGSTPAASADFSEDDITIPLTSEEVHVTKTPVVSEEVRLHKRSVENTKQVSARLRKEQLDVQKQGDIVIENTDPTGRTPDAPQ